MTFYITFSPQKSLTSVVESYIKHFQARLERYSNCPHVFQNFDLQNNVTMLMGPYDKRLVFQNVNFFNLQAGQILIQAHKTPLAILLSVSVKVSDQLFEGINSELYPPGLSYVKTTLSSDNPNSVLWEIVNEPEGVLSFPPCLLPESAFSPEIINFTFPLEALHFSPPSRDMGIQRLLKFTHQRGVLAFQNHQGDPPIQYPPINESQIRHFNQNQMFQEQNRYSDRIDHNSPALRPSNHHSQHKQNHQLYDPFQPPPNPMRPKPPVLPPRHPPPHPQTFQLSPATFARQMDEAIRRIQVPPAPTKRPNPILDTTLTPPPRSHQPRRLQFEEDEPENNLDLLNISNNISLSGERYPPGITPIRSTDSVVPNLATPALVLRATPALAPSVEAETQNLEAPTLDQESVDLAPPDQTQGPKPPAQETQDGAGALIIDNLAGALNIDDLTEEEEIEFNIRRVSNSSLLSATLQDPGTSTPIPIRTTIPPSPGSQNSTSENLFPGPPGSPNSTSGTPSPGPTVEVPEYLHQFIIDVQSDWNARFPYGKDAALFPLLTRDVSHQKYIINWHEASQKNISMLMIWKDTKQRKSSREPSPKT